MANSVTMMGRLGGDPEMRYTPTGTPVTNFNLANETGFGDNKVSSWYRVNCWGKTAEIANQYLVKGNRVVIHGEISIRKYTSNNGSEGTSVEIRCNNLEFIETNNSNSNNDPNVQRSQQPAAAPVDDAEDVEELPW